MSIRLQIKWLYLLVILLIFILLSFDYTSKFSLDTIFPLEIGKNKKCFGCLKFENGECPCNKFNTKVPKTYEEKRINQLKSVKAKGLKTGFKKNIS